MKIDWSKILINERPEGMSREEYKARQKAEKIIYKLYRKYGVDFIGEPPVQGEDNRTEGNTTPE